MIAIFLCAGYATRMGPLTGDVPKALLPVAGKPVLDYQMEEVITFPGITYVCTVTNQKFCGRFEEWQETWAERADQKNIRMRIINDGTTGNTNRLGACADLALALEGVDCSGPFLAAAGDTIYRFPLLPLWNQFLQQKNHLVLALKKYGKELEKTGVLQLAQDDRVLSLHEKPKKPPSNWSCPPLYFLMPGARAALSGFLKTQGPIDAPGHFIAHLCRKEPVFAARAKGKCLDIGSVALYRRAEKEISTR